MRITAEQSHQHEGHYMFWILQYTVSSPLLNFITIMLNALGSSLVKKGEDRFSSSCAIISIQHPSEMLIVKVHWLNMIW